MKLGMCSLHERMSVEFPCIAIRHDDGRKATPHEVWEWAMSIDRKAREECLTAVRNLLTAPECCDEYDRVVNDGLKEAMLAIRATISENDE